MADRGELITARLLMRRWRPDDSAPFAALNADARVMEYLPAPLRREKSDRLIASIEAHFEQHGYGFWALELRGSGELIGLTGLAQVRFQARFAPAVEVGWRLAHAHWRRGYATEAGHAALSFGLGQAGLDQIVSFTSIANERSRSVMQRIGMSRDPSEDFDHPLLPPSSQLRRHVLYRRWAGEGAERQPA